MKVTTLLLSFFIAFTTVNTTTAQFGKLAEKLLKGKSDKKPKSKEVMYDFSDPTGMSGTYYMNKSVVGSFTTIGFSFQEKIDGEIENILTVTFGKTYDKKTYYESGRLSEKYRNKYKFDYFAMRAHSMPDTDVNARGHAIAKIADDVYVFIIEDVVQSVLAKDKAALTDYDVETAQVLYDQKMKAIKKTELDKETASWMENKIFKNNVNKIVFAERNDLLCKRGLMNKKPMVDGKGFKSSIDMNKNVYYMAFFKYPPKDMFPGKEVNIVYEMNGASDSRVDCRAKGSKWGKMIPRLETSSFDDRQHSPRGLRFYSSYRSNWVQDYAFMNLLYSQKSKLMIGKTYDVTVKMYVNVDGENQDLLAEGLIRLEYSSAAHESFTKSEGVWDLFEDFLNE
ncbi:MAG: Unknown protein [uncultured Aureispira sp.]|uniref:Uncharacterized protein n=1 Tax=uncultured Aureispira sp. TaxID=1331704 RepID=A0A6S6SN66_9BACT|nr:MAG: Unknown protein [uncultured Aureispira sp.]